MSIMDVILGEHGFDQDSEQDTTRDGYTVVDSDQVTAYVNSVGMDLDIYVALEALDDLMDDITWITHEDEGVIMDLAALDSK